jgi:hypothetical protein
MAILAGLAQATLPNSKTPWQDYADDYDRIRAGVKPTREARRLGRPQSERERRNTG